MAFYDEKQNILTEDQSYFRTFFFIKMIQNNLIKKQSDLRIVFFPEYFDFYLLEGIF